MKARLAILRDGRLGDGQRPAGVVAQGSDPAPKVTGSEKPA